MGFGSGLRTPRRELFAFFAAVRIELVTPPSLRAVVVTPPGTRPRIPEPTSTSEAEARARLLVTTGIDRRTFVSDARDLLINTVAAISNVTLLESRPALSEATSSSESNRTVIHVGWNAWLSDLLASGAVPLPPEFDEFPRGLPRRIDGDGFVHLSFAAEGVRHAAIIGGSDRGTFFGVAHLLRQLGVQWLFPGPAGVSLPAGPAVLELPPLNWIEEPDYRGRDLRVMGWNQHGLVELDEIRDWCLRNGMDAGDIRHGFILPKANRAFADGACGPAIAQPDPFQDLRGPDSRLPIDHTLHLFCSPAEPEDLLGTSPQRRAQRHPEFYPDIRPRVTLPGVGPSFPGAEPPSAALTPMHGAQAMLSPTLFEQRPDASRCPDGAPAMAPTLRDAPGVLSTSLAAGAEGFASVLPADRATPYTEFVGVINRPIDSAVFGDLAVRAGRELRFVPRVRVRTTSAAFDPWSSGWKPCVFDADLAPGGDPLSSQRAELFRTVAGRALLTLLRRMTLASTIRDTGSRDFEASVSIAHTDGRGWCQCDGCARAFTVTSPLIPASGDPVPSYRFFRGRYLGQVAPGFVTASSPPVPDRLAANPADAASRQRFREQVYRRPANVDDAIRAQFPEMVGMNELCARGVLFDGHIRDTYTQVVVALAQGVAAVLRRMLPQPISERTLVLFLGYEDYRGAPMLSRSAGADRFDLPAPGQTLDGDPARLDAMLTPVLTGVRDQPEYARDYPASTEVVDRALDQPEQLNHHRWSVLASQTGVYEYLYGGGYAVPRLYSQRLRRGLRSARSMKAVVFNGEVGIASWMLEGPRLYELGRVLWNTETSVAQARADWCRALFGRAAPTHAGSVEVLIALVDALERAWERSLDAFLSRQFHVSRGLPLMNAGTATVAATARAPMESLAGFDDEEIWGRVDALARIAPEVAAVDPVAALRLDGLVKGLGIPRSLVNVTRRVRQLQQAMTPANRFDLSGPGGAAVRASLELLAAGIATVNGFRQEVRGPVHAALVTAGVVAGVGDSLLDHPGLRALRLAEPPTSHGPTTTSLGRLMISVPMISQYLGFWNGAVEELRLSSPTPFRLWSAQTRDKQSDGLGGYFTSIKAVIGDIVNAARASGRPVDELFPSDDARYNQLSNQG